MKKLLTILLSLALLIGLLPSVAFAAEDAQFSFELSIDGSDTKEVKSGDIVTVVLRLKRTDTDQSYTMYAMQDEIRYDSNFFELIPGSQILSDDIRSSDIGMVDSSRELYMNYLSSNGGAQWNSDSLIGSFQLRVTATSGASKITNQDYLVSVPDGSGSYPAVANEVTVVVSTDCTVRFESNGGTAVEDQTVSFGEKLAKPNDPTKAGFEFSGWYKDIHKTKLWDFGVDTVQENMTLYASWTEVSSESPASPSTGDNSPSWLYVLLGILLLILLAILCLFFRKSVTFHYDNGIPSKTVRVFPNKLIAKPQDPHKDGATFVGWYRNARCTIPWNFETDKVTKTTNLYAKWQ